MKIIFVYGTRPEVIKLALVIKEAIRREVKASQVWTGQHIDLARSFIQWFDLHPDFDLGLLTHDQKSAVVVSDLLHKLTPIMKKEQPDWLIVQGDTAATFAAGIAGFLAGVNVGHVEAGLQTWDLSQPFPEEAFRCMVSQVASLHFAPTPLARENLLKSGIREDIVRVTGNTVIDALLWTIDRLDSGEVPDVPKVLPELNDKRKMVLITGHRRESFGPGIEAVCRAIKESALAYPDHLWVYPVHFNPNVYESVHKFLSGIDNIRLIDPPSYPAFVELMRRSRLIITDSGGIQEEAPSLGVPVLVTRAATERPEAIEARTAYLAGTDERLTFEWVERLLEDDKLAKRMPKVASPFGDGHAAERILEAILEYHDDS